MNLRELVEHALTDEVLGRIEFDAQELAVQTADCGGDHACEYGRAWRNRIIAALEAQANAEGQEFPAAAAMTLSESAPSNKTEIPQDAINATSVKQPAPSAPIAARRKP